VTERLRRIGVWIVFGAGLFLRIWTLDQKSPWLDEAASWQFATADMAQLMWWTATDVHPPLYFLLLKGWIGIWGDSLAALRALSVVGGMAALYFAYRLALLLLHRWVALAVLLWCAVSPLTIYYSQEARMYALAMACALGACYGYARWVDSGFENRRALAGYAAGVIAALYLHYFTALLFAAIWMHAVFARARRRRWIPWRFWVFAHSAVAVLYLPWVSTALAQVAQGQAWWRGAVDPLGEIPGYSLTLFYELAVGTLGVQLIGTYTGPIVFLLLSVGLAGLAGAAFHGGNDRLVAFIALVPPVAGLMLLLAGGHMELSRYLCYAAPLLVIGAARGMAALNLRPAVAAAVMAGGALALLPSLGRYYQAQTKDSDVRPIVAYLNDARRAHPGGAVLVMPGYVVSLAKYVSQSGLPVRGIDTDADFSRALARSGRAVKPTWLIVDYRWPGFAALARDRRFREEAIAATTPDRIKLYRLD